MSWANRKLGKKEGSVKLPSWNIPKKQKLEFPRPNLPVRIVYVWALIFVAMLIYALAWFSMGLVIFPFVNAIRAAYDFGTPWNTVADFIINCFLWHPIISLVGWFIYGILNSLKRDVDTWRTF